MSFIFHHLSPPRFCTEMSIFNFQEQKSSVLLDYNCGKTSPFICKRSHNRHLTSLPRDSDWRQYLPEEYFTNLPTMCQEGFIDTDTKCFKVHDRRLGWHDALKHCWDHYGNQSSLASFHSNNDKIVISQYLKPTTDYWLGLSFDLGLFWTDNSNVTLLPWLKPMIEEDTETDFKYFIDNSCGHFTNKGISLEIRKGTCKSPKGFICQIDKHSKTATDLKDLLNVSICSSGYYGYEKSCYKFVQERRNFYDAEKLCKQDHGSHVTSVESDMENVVLQLIAKDNNVTNIWLGLKLQRQLYHQLQQKPLFLWNNGHPVLFTRWLREPNLPKFPEQYMCAQLTQNIPKWKLVSCNENLPFICKSNQQNTEITVPNNGSFCPQPWYSFRNSCYITEQDRFVTWKDAVENCLHIDSMASLAPLNSDIERQVVKYYTEDKGLKGLWIGAYMDRNNVSRTADGSNVLHQHLKNNVDLELNVTAKCAVMMSDVISYNNCDEKHGFVCKMQQYKHPSETSSKASEPSVVCPDEKWTKMGKYCYLFFPDQYISWTQAEQLCNQNHNPNILQHTLKGSHLVSVHSVRENHFLQTMLLERTKLPFHRWAWIGYHKLSPGADHPWKWTDGENDGYQNWYLSDRNMETFDNENLCVALDAFTGVWGIKACSNLFGAVCKVPIKKKNKIPSMMETTQSTIIFSTKPSLDFTSQKINKKHQNLTDPKTNKNHTNNGIDPSEFNIIIGVLIFAVVIFIFIIIVIVLKYRKILKFPSLSSCVDSDTIDLGNEDDYEEHL